MLQKTSTPSVIDVSVIITAHAESILIHKTLASVRRAIRALGQENTSEIVLHIDNPTGGTIDYLKVHEKTTLKNVKVFQNSFGDLGLSRNFAVSQSAGKYIATIDADDLMSEQWLKRAITLLELQSQPTVAHSEFTIEFEGADSIVIKHGEINKATDTLLSVYANRWNSVIVAPRKLLLDEPYMPNSPGYGYEDWHLNCRLIHKDIHNILVPKTAIFVRRKMANSEWLRQAQSMAVLRANPLLSFESIRAIPTNPFAHEVTPTRPVLVSQSGLRQLAKRIAAQYPLAHKAAKRVKLALKREKLARASLHIPDWLKKEWMGLHVIDTQIFPSHDLLDHIAVYDSLTSEHKITGSLYKQLVDSLHHDTYDYLIFVPWLIKGGADKYAINYANSISKANPKKRVLVVATLPVASAWHDNLDSSVDFLDFGMITQTASTEIKYRLMSHLIENSGISHIHIINSEFGYDFVRLHERYLKANDKKIIVTSFSQSVDKEGRLFGYSHTHVPFVYDLASLITSDNQAVIGMWEQTYGFDPKKMLVHRQPVHLDKQTPERSQPHRPLRILWAARVSPEKQPELLSQIGHQVKGSATIDIYGTVESGSKHYLSNLPDNVTYRGVFDGLSNLHLNQYDCLLYTSLFDGMPNTILEAAKEHLPIIASNVGGISEFINDDTGILVTDIRNASAYSKAINEILAHPEKAAKHAQNAYIKLKDEFSPEQYEKDIQLFLKRLDY